MEELHHINYIVVLYLFCLPRATYWMFLTVDTEKVLKHSFKWGMGYGGSLQTRSDDTKAGICAVLLDILQSYVDHTDPYPTS